MTRQVYLKKRPALLNHYTGKLAYNASKASFMSAMFLLLLIEKPLNTLAIRF